MTATQPVTRTCPECGEPQDWCEKAGCLLTEVMGSGHWSHLAVESDCKNLGDVNTNPSKAPDNVYTRGLL